MFSDDPTVDCFSMSQGGETTPRASGSVSHRTLSASQRLVVLAAVRDHEWRQHIRSVLDSCSALAFVGDVCELATAASNRAPDAVLWHLDGHLESKESYSIEFRRLRHIAPRCYVIAYGQIDHSFASLALIAGEIGVDRVLVRGFDDLAQSIRNLVKAPSLEPIVRAALSILALPSGPVATTVRHCLRRTTTGRITVQQLAHDLKVNRKTISVWLREAGLPAPERLIGWCRVYWVAHLLSTSNMSIGHVARVLHFASTTDLRRLVTTYTGGTATALRETGSAARLLVAIHLDDVRSTRESTAL